MKAILLAAGVGKRFGKRTKVLPKCLIPIGPKNETLLSRYFDSFRELGIKNIIIVCGHQAHKIKAACKKTSTGLKIKFIINKDYRKGSILSLYTASKELNENVLIMDADVYFPTKALKNLIHSKKKNAFLCDTKVKSSGEEMMLMAKKGRLVSIAKKTDPKLKAVGESVGFLKLDKNSAKVLRTILKAYVQKGLVYEEHESTYPELMKKIKLGFESMARLPWTEMDFEEDYKKILELSKVKNTL